MGNFSSQYSKWRRGSEREFCVYAGIDKNNNGVLDISEEAIRKVKVIVVKVKLYRVDFDGLPMGRQSPSGDYNSDTFADNGSYQITWEALDSNFDGDCYTNETSHPICYKRQTTPQMTIMIKTEPSLSYSLAGKLKVSGFHGSGGLETFYEADKALIGSQTIFENQSWNKSLPNEISKKNLSLDWDFSIYGDGHYFRIGKTVNELFLIYDNPIQANSAQSLNCLTCKRISEVAYQLVSRFQGNAEISNPESQIDEIASAAHKWLATQTFGSRITARCNYASEIWELLDNTRQGQCAQNAMLMEQSLRLIGRNSVYCHVFASDGLPAYISIYQSKAVPNVKEIGGPLPRDGDGKCPYCHVYENLCLDFIEPGLIWDTHNPNQGEGCCYINGCLYPAYIENIVGKIGRPSQAESAPHSILLQMEASQPGKFQRWCEKYTRNWCQDPIEAHTRVSVPGYIY